jgi:hypothetical protein
MNVQYPSQTLARPSYQNSVHSAKTSPFCNRKHDGPKYPNHWSSRLHVIAFPPLWVVNTDFLNRGGSLIADFLASNNPLPKKQNIIAAVRSEEQAKALSKLGISVLQLDLNDEEAVVGRILQHNSMKLYTLI